MDPKILFIQPFKDIRNCVYNSNIVHLSLYKGNNVFYKIIRRLPFLCRFTLNMTKNLLMQFDIIVLSDAVSTNAIIKWFINNKNKSSRLIILCLNKVSSISNISFSLLRKWDCEIWSYNRDDCNYFNFKHINQFLNYDYFIQNDFKTDTISYDAVFMGAKKDRENEIRLIKTQLQSEYLSAWFYVPDIKEFNQGKKNNERFPYKNYISICKQSKSIVDIVSRANYGLTWRPIEALFLQKKLITNYLDIVKEEFYCKENIYIIGLEERCIKDFLAIPYKKIKFDITKKYDFNYVINEIITR